MPFTPEQADSLIVWIEDGQTLRAWCRIEGNPSKSTVYDWEKQDAEFAGRFARAREIGEHAIAEESLEIVDEKPTCEFPDPDGGVSVRIDPAGVQRNRIRAEHRLKLLAKWNPRKWGERIQQEVTGKDGGPVQFSVKSILEKE